MLTGISGLQAAIISKLKTDATLMGTIKEVYDRIPEDTEAAQPFIIVGPFKFAPWDTRTSRGFEVLCMISVIWSRDLVEPGPMELIDVLSRVWELLDRKQNNIVLPGWNVASCCMEEGDYLQDADGAGMDGTLTFKVQIQRTS